MDHDERDREVREALADLERPTFDRAFDGDGWTRADLPGSYRELQLAESVDPSCWDPDNRVVTRRPERLTANSQIARFDFYAKSDANIGNPWGWELELDITFEDNVSRGEMVIIGYPAEGDADLLPRVYGPVQYVTRQRVVLPFPGAVILLSIEDGPGSAANGAPITVQARATRLEQADQASGGRYLWSRETLTLPAAPATTGASVIPFGTVACRLTMGEVAPTSSGSGREAVVTLTNRRGVVILSYRADPADSGLFNHWVPVVNEAQFDGVPVGAALPIIGVGTLVLTAVEDVQVVFNIEWLIDLHDNVYGLGA